MIKWIGLILILAIIAYEDWKSQEISLWVFLLWGAFLVTTWLMEPLSLKKDLLYNLGIVGLNIAVIWGYIQLRFKPTSPKLFKHFGAGDLFFLILMALSFTTFVFALQLTAGLVFTLVLFYALKVVLQWKQNKIPLAGGLSVWLIAYILYGPIGGGMV